ncbi:MAG: hypothetical protein V1701_07875 [Planctomycetota bacterium]
MFFSEIIAKRKKALLWETIGLGIIGLVFLPLSFIMIIAPIYIYFYMLGVILPFWAVLLIAAALMAFDSFYYPGEKWVKVKYILASGKESGPAPLEREKILDVFPILESRLPKKGIFGGVPYIANMSDPGNWITWIRGLANGFTNIILGGPRKLRESLGCLLVWRKIDGPAEQRLNSLLMFLKENNGEYVVSKMGKSEQMIPEMALAPLAVRLELICPFRKWATEEFGYRLDHEII